MRGRHESSTMRLVFLMTFGLIWGMLLPGLLLLPIFNGKPLIAHVRAADSPLGDIRGFPKSLLDKKEIPQSNKLKLQKKSGPPKTQTK